MSKQAVSEAERDLEQDRPLHIILHCDQFAPMPAAAAYRMKTLAEAFVAAGDDVTVITSGLNQSYGEYFPQGMKIEYVPTVSLGKKKTLARRIRNMLSFSLGSLSAARRCGEADVLISSIPTPFVGLAGWWIAKKKRAKFVLDVRDIWPEVAIEMDVFSNNCFYSRLFRKISDFLYHKADAITVVSPGKVNKIANKLRDDDKIKLFSNGFDEEITQLGEDNNIIEKYDFDHNSTCVYIGNLGLAQNLSVLLDAAEKLRSEHLQFLIFGKGAEEQLLRDRVEKEGLKNVRICGLLEHHLVPTVLRHASISYIPLKTAAMRDSVPTKLYESLGLGCPVLLVAEGDAADVIAETGFGRSISPDDADQVALVLKDMLLHYDSLMERQDDAIRIVRSKYSRQKIAIQYVRYIKQMMKGKEEIPAWSM